MRIWFNAIRHRFHWSILLVLKEGGIHFCVSIRLQPFRFAFQSSATSAQRS